MTSRWVCALGAVTALVCGAWAGDALSTSPEADVAEIYEAREFAGPRARARPDAEGRCTPTPA